MLSCQRGDLVVLLEEAKPDPGDYHPEPEWYFLFQMLRWKIFAGEFGQFLGATAIPGAFMLLLAALPFIDRSAIFSSVPSRCCPGPWS
jgi:ubiquinol-cytochrome c reductase cytochrome b subunit